jgi:hypothetical protein
MSSRRALAYLILALALGGAYFLATRWETRQAEQETRASRIFDLEAGPVDALKIRRAAEPEIVIERVSPAAEAEGEKRKAAWRITAPGAFAADARAVEDVIGAFVRVKKERTLEERAPDPSAYGLDAPALGVSVRAGGSRWGLAFGAENFSGDARYVRVDGSEAILLVAMAAYNRMDRGLEGLRDRRLLPLDETRISAIGIARGEQRLRLEKGEQGWSLAGSPRPVSEERVESLIAALTETEVDRFVSEADGDRPRYGLETPDVAVAFTLGDAEAWLRISKAAADSDEAAFAARSSATGVVALPRRVLEAFPATGADLEDRRLLRADASDVRALHRVQAGERLSFVKAGDAWKRQAEAPEARKERQEGERTAPDVEAFLAILSDLDHEGAPAGPAGPLPDPEMRLRLGSDAEVPLLTLDIAPAGEGEAGRQGWLADAAGERGVRLSPATIESLYDALRALDPHAPSESDAPEAESAEP